jgi:hypothetical protein
MVVVAAAQRFAPNGLLHAIARWRPISWPVLTCEAIMMELAAKKPRERRERPRVAWVRLEAVTRQ